ncbi:hypothetical protein KJ951_03000 [Patescibacteria group bacterium]|nr:hypothetical protein [Patescibacteria group bacterium]MBU1703348.1 hypothetical protein [Patescibacteria group bacterium]MBU1953872.1 hypothetical protein [Patescibacteria group bacterium]
MPNFTPIKNSLLRSLVIASDAITSLPEDEVQVMVDNIAKMSVEGQKELIEYLEREQYESQKQMRQTSAAITKMESIRKNIEATGRAFQRENEGKAAESEAEDILKTI